MVGNSDQNSPRKVRMVNGYDARQLGISFPYQVSLWLRHRYICGGAIISSDFVLTAAHCVCVFDEKGVPKYYYSARFLNVCGGSIYRNSDERVCIGVSRVIPHEHHNGNYDDIALLELRISFTFTSSIQYIELPKQETWAGARVLVGGWGRVSTSGRDSDILKAAVFSVMPKENCTAIIGFSTDKVLCMAHRQRQNTCYGDSGSPAIGANSELVGIDSGSVTDDSSCEDPSPELFVNVAYFAKWIRRNSNVDYM